MFLEIVFCSFLLVVGTGSADDFCTKVLSIHKDIRDTLPVYEDEKKNKHCFFRLSAADEKVSAQIDSGSSTGKSWNWNKDKAIGGCKKYNAFLPHLKDPKITETFWKATNKTLKTASAILLGLKMGTYTAEKPPSGSTVDVTWDDNTPQKIDRPMVYGKYNFSFPKADEKSTCNGYADLDTIDGSWACNEPGLPTWAPVIFCQVTNPKAPPPAATPNPPTADVVGPVSTVIVLATTISVIHQMLSHRITE